MGLGPSVLSWTLGLFVKIDHSTTFPGTIGAISATNEEGIVVITIKCEGRSKIIFDRINGAWWGKDLLKGPCAVLALVELDGPSRGGRVGGGK